MNLFKGSAVAMVTPLNQEGIDLDALDDLIDWQIENNTDAIVISGTTGECATLSYEEKKELFEHTVKKVAGRCSVIAGTGTNDTSKAIMLSQLAEASGADALLVVTPYYNKGTQKGMIAHFTAIADAVKTPIILYNVPSRTGINLLPKTVLTLSNHPNIVGIKEASADISQMMELFRILPDDFLIYSGNDDHIVPMLSLGGAGVISTVANVLPKETHDLVNAFLKGDLKEALKIQFYINPLVQQLFIETNPIPVKTALGLMGKKVGHLRLPLTDMEDEHLQTLTQALKDYALIE